MKNLKIPFMITRQGNLNMSSDEEFQLDLNQVYEDAYVLSLSDYFTAGAVNMNKNLSSNLEETNYRVFSSEEIFNHMGTTVKQVCSILELPETTARKLLNHFKWDQEKLIEKYYDDNPQAFFKKVNVNNPFIKNVYNKSESIGDKICGICITAVPFADAMSLNCGHFFCNQCWVDYLTHKIMVDSMGDVILCPAIKCTLNVEYPIIMKIITDTKVQEKYQQLLASGFIQCNRLLRWCTAPDCTYTIKIEYLKQQAVECLCGNIMCFACGEYGHHPITCQLLKQWIHFSEDESQTLNWILTNTKACPQCQTAIEKNGGCNHITCTKCSHSYCWLCFRPWNGHGSCNAFTTTKAQEKSQLRMNKFKHYKGRYANHLQSMKLESKLRDLSPDFFLFKEAHRMLVKCRQTLLSTYVFAYYVESDNQSLIFEDNQGFLELATEKLSYYLEKEFLTDGPSTVKGNLINKTDYCKNCRQVLLDHVQEGYKMHWWRMLN